MQKIERESHSFYRISDEILCIDFSKAEKITRENHDVEDYHDTTYTVLINGVEIVFCKANDSTSHGDRYFISKVNGEELLVEKDGNCLPFTIPEGLFNRIERIYDNFKEKPVEVSKRIHDIVAYQRYDGIQLNTLERLIPKIDFNKATSFSTYSRWSEDYDYCYTYYVVFFDNCRLVFVDYEDEGEHEYYLEDVNGQNIASKAEFSGAKVRVGKDIIEKIENACRERYANFDMDLIEVVKRLTENGTES